MSQQQKKLDPKQIGEFLTNMKKQMGQVEGECTMMKNDAISSLFQSVANMINAVYKEKEEFENKFGEVEATLEKIYQGHPDIKISMESEVKEAKEKAEKKQAKVIKKG